MSQSLSIFDPASPQAASIRSLSFLVLAITGFIFLVVEGVLIYVVVRFRWRGRSGTPEPPQVYGSKPIEIAWTAAPAIIVFILGLVTTRTLWEVNGAGKTQKPAAGTLFVTVIGHQWWWEYRYETYDGRVLGFVTANELHIPASDSVLRRPIVLTLESADVCHSFWVPRLAGKMDLIPGRINRLEFDTSERGLFVGQCAEYCGTQHANMLLRVVVDAPADFDRWLTNEASSANDDPSGRDGNGKGVFLSQSCVNCHRVRGRGLRTRPDAFQRASDTGCWYFTEYARKSAPLDR
jgi:cytochrome c oxidase subunit 2